MGAVVLHRSGGGRLPLRKSFSIQANGSPPPSSLLPNLGCSVSLTPGASWRGGVGFSFQATPFHSQASGKPRLPVDFPLARQNSLDAGVRWRGGGRLFFKGVQGSQLTGGEAWERIQLLDAVPTPKPFDRLVKLFPAWLNIVPICNGSGCLPEEVLGVSFIRRILSQHRGRGLSQRL